MGSFKKEINRRGTNSVKWDLASSIYGSSEVLPMWVADMDFETPFTVKEALTERAEHGIFGYTYTDTSVHSSIIDWITRRHRWEIKASWLVYSPGVIPTLHAAIEALTRPNDRVLIQTPVYPPFYDVIKKHDRTLVTNPLMLKDNQYSIDFDDFAEKIKHVSLFILCNPHNPVGRVWTEEELRKMAELCIANHVTIISDEIHADLIYHNNKHIPIGALSNEINHQTVTCMSPTKTFNLAGLQASFAFTPNKQLRDNLKKQFEKHGINYLNTMGLVAMQVAYQTGEQWLNELINILEENKTIVTNALANVEEINVIEPQGTYLIWMDCRNMGLDHEQLKKFMIEQAKLGLNDGITFGQEGEGFMRLNIACPPDTVKNGMKRLLTALGK
ncbi:MalY/PatB family protein [Aquibacillus salsiterrae]|uniref:cysteine-S-conjugate beta-lyase n=1 Tax=Aquibacillus salsiterrae TaxID=2950439 RepID=A0A9X3WEC5_9BACI|nr:MalY/PatB family protein [Aquibacillus salsiterrae]MDC3418295.1 pyridoxal phosphate-dependent aminotransferase [Aquibacillus salsiterrae]